MSASLLWGLYSTVYKLKCVELIIPQITLACITDAATNLPDDDFHVGTLDCGCSSKWI